jgi:hypothetical protein
LRQLDLLRIEHGVRNTRNDLEKYLAPLWEKGHISAGELWALYARYPYLARLKNWSVLEESLRSTLNEIAWEHVGFALATGYDEQTGDYQGLAIPHQDSFGPITHSTLLVHPARALAQRARERSESVVKEAAAHGVTLEPEAPGVFRVVPPEQRPEPEPARPSRFFGVYRLDPDPTRRMKQLVDLDREVLQHLSGEGVELHVSIEITATRRGGFTDEQLRTVRENVRALRFEQSEFEAE